MFNLCIREAFVDMYQVDVLKMLKDHMERNTPEPLPNLPEQGSLVLEGVLDSEFFFS
jgi:DNA-directed RNA polymerase